MTHLEHWHFEVIQKAEGGFTARCLPFKISLEAHNLEALHDQIMQSIEQVISKENMRRPQPNEVKLIFYKN